ncbi:hypothetical protein ACPOL_5350 [Acidisarcina polymorpha]|uniref:Uncharacterized protein n=1 Tax=Acidisarcina polymorpha TaxID=2211140 RepID=A0A2Z5G674_9BACT|nr:hypothetical protein ACPOL_5350 [Acidisarcina polymorpha]
MRSLSLEAYWTNERKVIRNGGLARRLPAARFFFGPKTTLKLFWRVVSDRKTDAIAQQKKFARV